VLSRGQDKAQKILHWFSHELRNAETLYPAYNREVLGIRDRTLYWKINLHQAEQPFVVHTDHVPLNWILTQPHLTMHRMDIPMVLQHIDWEVKLILGVQNQVRDMLSRHPTFTWERRNWITLEVPAAGEWIDDIKPGIVHEEWFGTIADFLASPSPHPLPSTASTKQHKSLVPAQRFCLEDNGLLWLHGDLEKKQGKNNSRAQTMDE